MPKIYSRSKIRIPNIFANVKNKRKLAMITIFITAIVISAKVMLDAVNPIFDTLCENEAKSLATIISNEQATNVMREHSYDELFTVEKDTNGNVTMIKSNVIPINEIISDVAIKIQEEINKQGRQDIEIALGSFTFDRRSLIPENSTIANVNPIAFAREYSTLSMKFISFWIVNRAIPKTAQFVVISGKNIPSAWYSISDVFFIMHRAERFFRKLGNLEKFYPA